MNPLFSGGFLSFKYSIHKPRNMSNESLIPNDMLDVGSLPVLSTIPEGIHNGQLTLENAAIKIAIWAVKENYCRRRVSESQLLGGGRTRW